MGRNVTDTTCQGASEMLYETIAVSLFRSPPTPALLAASGFSTVVSQSCFLLFFFVLLSSQGFLCVRETARNPSFSFLKIRLKQVLQVWDQGNLTNEIYTFCLFACLQLQDRKDHVPTVVTGQLKALISCWSANWICRYTHMSWWS